MKYQCKELLSKPMNNTEIKSLFNCSLNSLDNIDVLLKRNILKDDKDFNKIEDIVESSYNVFYSLKDCLELYFTIGQNEKLKERILTLQTYLSNNLETLNHLISNAYEDINLVDKFKKYLTSSLSFTNSHLF